MALSTHVSTQDANRATSMEAVPVPGSVVSDIAVSFQADVIKAPPPAPRAAINAGSTEYPHCRLPNWPPLKFQEPVSMPTWESKQPLGCPVLHDEWSYHCTPSACIPRGKRVALLFGNGQLTSRLTTNQFQTLLSNADAGP